MLDVDRLEGHIRAELLRRQVPGLAVAVVQGHELLYAQGFGVTNTEDAGLPVTPRTLFRIASVTKPLTATAIMRLVDSGALALDVPVTEYVPWLRFSEQGAAGRVTLRMLLSHTSGLSTGQTVLHGRRDPEGLEDYVRHEVPRLPLVAPPGTIPAYSNANANIAGFVAEVVAGKPFAGVVQELVFEPLEMHRSTFDPLMALTYPLAHGHDLEGGAPRPQRRFVETTGFHPAGCAMTTALDIANFTVMHLDGGRFRGRQVLSAGSAAEMQRLHASFATVPGAGYGLGFEMGRRAGVRRWIGHLGGAAGMSAQWWLLPAERVGVILLCNLLDNAFLDQLCTRILDALLGPVPAQPARPPPVDPDRAWWPRYIGTYAGPDGDVARIRLVDGRLLLDWRGRRTGSAPLQAVGEHQYFADLPDGRPGAYVGFVPQPEGPTRYLLLNGGWCRRTDDDQRGSGEPTTT